jgi:hypothetical protein
LPGLHHNARSSRWVAIAAAYLLVLQAVFAGMASGAHASGMSLDRTLAMTLCATGDMLPGDHSDQASTQHDLMSCCVPGSACPGGDGAPANDAYLPVVHRAIDLIAFARHLDAPHGYVAGRSPANPRAPPSQV